MEHRTQHFIHNAILALHITMTMGRMRRTMLDCGAQQGPDLMPHGGPELWAPVRQDGGGHTKPTKNMIHKGLSYFQSSDGCSLIGHGDQNNQFGHTLSPHKQAVVSLG